MTKPIDNRPYAFHLRKEIGINFVINIVINFGAGYATYRQWEVIQAWGFKGYVFDFMLAGLFLSVILTVIMVRNYRRKNLSLQLSPAATAIERLSDAAPDRLWPLCVVAAAVGVAIAIVSALALVPIASVVSFSVVGLALIKGIWAGLLACLVVAVAVRKGMALNQRIAAPAQNAEVAPLLNESGCK